VRVRADGSDTVADVKRALAREAKIPAHELCLKWMNEPMGRVHTGQDAAVDDGVTLASRNVTMWLKKFPHWRATMCVLNGPPVDTLEAIHFATAVHLKKKDPQAYVDSIRDTPEWTDFGN
jgi:hypothetical protein